MKEGWEGGRFDSKVNDVDGEGVCDDGDAKIERSIF